MNGGAIKRLTLDKGFLKMERKSKSVRKPAEVYHECPACSSRELIRLEVDVLCGDCDWMSCEEFVEMGGMDNIFAAFNDHFLPNQGEEILELAAEQLRDRNREDEENSNNDFPAVVVA